MKKKIKKQCGLGKHKNLPTKYYFGNKNSKAGKKLTSLRITQMQNLWDKIYQSGYKIKYNRHKNTLNFRRSYHSISV